MDLVETLSVLTGVVDALTELAKEQAIIIEQYQMIDRKDVLEHRAKLDELDEKLMCLGTRAARRKGEKGGGADG